MSPPLSLLETIGQQWKENRRIVLVVSGGYRSDTYIDSCLAYSLTSLIYCICFYFNLFLLKDQYFHAHNRSSHNAGCDQYSCRYGGKGGQESKTQKKGNSTASPGPSHGKGYGHEDGQGDQSEVLMILNILAAGSSE